MQDDVGVQHRDERLEVAVAFGGEECIHDLPLRGGLGRSWELLRRSAAGGVFPDFQDRDLTDSARAYHGANDERLTRITARYHPDGTFRLQGER